MDPFRLTGFNVKASSSKLGNFLMDVDVPMFCSVVEMFFCIC